MSKRVLLTLICAAGATIASFAQPTTSKPDDPNGPKIVFEVMEFNFDTIMQGDTVKYTFRFKNTGKAPLLISDVHVQCGCTVPQYSKEPIAAGKSGTIYVEFRSYGKMGYQDKWITVMSNSNGGDVILHLKGTVVVAAKPAPAPAPGKDAQRGGAPVNK